MTTKEFFEASYRNEITMNEMYSYIQKITDSFDSNKIKWLLLDFDDFLFQKRIKKMESLTDNEILNKVKSFEDEYAGSYPYDLRNRISQQMYLSYTHGTLNAVAEELRISKEITCRLFPDSETEYIDFELVVYRGEFDGIYILQSVLHSILSEIDYNYDNKQYEIKADVCTTPQLINPIHWLKGEESLRQFLESLKSAGLIENRETDEIIGEHFFYVDGQEPTKEPQPIIWKSKKVLLAHLIGGLDSSVKTDQLWKNLAPHFHWKRKTPTGLRQSYHNNPYPNNIDVIKDILKKIKESK